MRFALGLIMPALAAGLALPRRHWGVSPARNSMALKRPTLNMVAAEPPVASARLEKAFGESTTSGKAALVGYITAGYPTADDTVELLLSMQEGGVDVIELGVPFTDPQADGATIQGSNQVALKNGIGMQDCINFVEAARAKGLTVPVVLMGYFNPFLAYGADKLIGAAAEAGIDGLIIVDLPPEEDEEFISKCNNAGLAFVPLITPT